MRTPLALGLALALGTLGACSDMADASLTPDAKPTTPGSADAAVAPHPDAASAPTADAGPEDLDMTLADFDFSSLQTQMMMPAGRSYNVANLLGHEAEALAVASSASGGDFPVGSVVEVQGGEAMVKRRKGFDATTNDWEFFGIQFAADGQTAQSFTLRGTETTACFMCHSMVSTVKWDFMCDHP